MSVFILINILLNKVNVENEVHVTVIKIFSARVFSQFSNFWMANALHSFANFISLYWITTYSLMFGLWVKDNESQIGQNWGVCEFHEYKIADDHSSTAEI